jgi:cbb3-type cytochrome oxidase subunit 3
MLTTKSRRAQIEMGETIAVLFIFLILVAFGFIFYARMQKSSYTEQQEENIALKAVEVAQKVSFLPELRCSSENVPVHNCIDTFKIMQFRALAAKHNLFYYDAFLYSNISLEQVFPTPEPGDPIFWHEDPGGDPAKSGPCKVVIYENQPVDSAGMPKWTSKTSTQVPTLLFDPIEGIAGQYYFGVLYVDVYN